MWKERLSKALTPQVWEERDSWRQQAEYYHNALKAEIETSEALLFEIGLHTSEEEKCLQDTSMELTQSPIDSYLGNIGYKVIKDIAYTDKRGGVTISLNQMITPRAWEVVNFRNKYKKYTNIYNRIQALGDGVAKITTWVDEKKLYKKDLYWYPEETLTLYKDRCDCEDVSNLMASFEPEFMGVCYGYYHPKGGKKFGHAFPIFLDDQKLYIVETTSNKVEITNWDDERYEPYFIITQNKTYKLKGGVRFGALAK